MKDCCLVFSLYIYINSTRIKTKQKHNLEATRTEISLCLHNNMTIVFINFTQLI
jgi:hypothetical protein